MSNDDPKVKSTSFKSEDEMWAYIEEQGNLLNQLDDAFSALKQQPKAHEGVPECPTPFKDTERRALEGDPISQYNLAIAYGNGDGVQQDEEKAAYRTLKSAESGFAPAQYNVGCYWLNSGDRQKAFEWFMLAPKQNFGPAQFNVGHLYGRVGDYQRAYIWFYLAEQNRVTQAKQNREQAASFLTSGDLNEARLAISCLMMDFRKGS